jgi:GTP-binding protein
VLIHVLDGLSEDPISDFAQINSEMALFDEKIAEKPQLVVLNKMDLPSVQERWPEVQQAITDLGYEIMPISTVTHENVNALMWKTHAIQEEAPEPEAVEAMPVYRASEDPRAFSIEEVEEGWLVKGAAIERAAAMTYWEHRESMRRFQRLMENIGVEEALREAGIEEGDTVFIGEYELEWQD